MSVKALRPSFARRSNNASRNLDSRGMSMCDGGAREREWLPREDIHAYTCAMRAIEDLSLAAVSLSWCVASFTP